MSTGCASQRVVSVLSQNDLHAMSAVAPSVVVEATSVRLPMPVSGAAVAYADVDRALDEAISAAAVPVLEAHGRGRYELVVELIEAHAEYAGSRLVVALTVRATLRGRAGNTYVAQTHARATASGAVAPEQGGSVVLTASHSIASKLAGFLLGLEL
ncbi:MAG TPA: hypothetical protein VH062_23310 [Polyangiaceae bacterium]|nr:hypothetical protein [Polyangiaceae bacterium]